MRVRMGLHIGAAEARDGEYDLERTEKLLRA